MLGGSISGDGRYVVFSTTAAGLVPGDTNGFGDVFVRDRWGGTTQRVSVGPGGVQANHHSEKATISAGGRYVVFESRASNLVPGDLNGVSDVFVHDLQSGTNTLVSVDSSGAQHHSGTGSALTNTPRISADGRYVAFWSASDELVANDTNGCADIFLRDLWSGTTTRVSVDSLGQEADDQSGEVAISADGRFVAFTSFANNLVPGDTNDDSDVFVHDLQTGETTRVSVDSSGAQGSGRSAWGVALSADGRYAAFTSGSALVPEDVNGINDIYVRDRQSGVTRCASVDASGVVGNNQTYFPSISANGRYVVFESASTNLVPLDSNLRIDVFVHDMDTGATWRASVDSSGTQGDDDSFGGWISGDGSIVAFQSRARHLVGGDTNNLQDVFAFDVAEVNVGLFCPGDGTGAACPCANDGSPYHGCENASATGGALLGASGFASLSNDSLTLVSSGERWRVLSIFIHGDQETSPVLFGDGLLCTGGQLYKLYVTQSSMSDATVPEAGDPSVSARSAFLGDVIPAGGVRWYQAYYRDPDLGFCPLPQGSTFNSSNGLRVTWAP